MRAFPKWYAFNSIYAFFPFTVPNQTSTALKSRDLSSTYSVDPPKPPATNVHFIEDYNACAKILQDPDTFKIWWGPVIKGLTGGVYMLSGDTKETTDQHKNLFKNVYCPGSTKAMWDFWTANTTELVKAKAFKVGDHFEVDIVRE
jgi:linoleate 10R-lipoxygenase